MKIKSPFDIQIVNRQGKKYVRAVPKTAFEPTPAQIEARIKFGEIASLVKGIKGLDPETGRPKASVAVEELMKGKTFEPHKEKPSVLEERLADFLIYYYLLTPEEKELFLQKVKEKLK
jgi:hypothetical protein